MKTLLGLLTFISLSVPSSALAQEQAAPLDGPARIFHDELLDKMAGCWKLSGKVAGRAANHSVDAGWVLNHQFLKIDESDVAAPAEGGVRYEAMVFVGYDNASERYVAHWIDVFGGRFSETLGYGKRSGNEIQFVFEYPDGPFHTTFRWIPEAGARQWLMMTKDQQGKWTGFGDMTLTRASK